MVLLQRNMDNNKTTSQTSEEETQENVDIITHLPEEVLKLIFKFLPFCDLVNIRKVCTIFDYMTMDTSVWKHAPLKVTDHTLNELIKAPYLHTLGGRVFDGDALLDTLVDNLVDLRILKCEIYGKVTVDKFQKFLVKFKNLEHVSFYEDVTESPEQVDMLKICSNLKSLSLYRYRNLNNLPHIIRTIGNGFNALRSLYFDDDFHIEGNNALLEMLRGKITQLTDLSLLGSDIHPDVLEMMFKSTKLESFHIYVNKNPGIPLDMSKMTSLKTLIIATKCNLLTPREASLVYKKIIFPQTIEFLSIRLMCKVEYSTGIIANAVKSLPNLKVLQAFSVNDPDVDKQLENLPALANVYSVRIWFCPSFTSNGAEHIMRCKNLKYLDMSDVLFTDSTYQCLIDCKNLCEISFIKCTFDSDKLIQAIWPLKYFTKLVLTGCSKIVNSGNIVKIDTQVVRRTENGIFLK